MLINSFSRKSIISLSLILGVVIGAVLFSINLTPSSSTVIAQTGTQPDNMTDYMCYKVADQSLPDEFPNGLVVTHINPALDGIQQSIRLEGAELFCTPVMKSIDANASAQIFINEFESNPTGADLNNERIELFNPSTQSVDISGWTLGGLAGVASTAALSEGSIIPPFGLLIVFLPGEFLDNVDETIELRDSSGALVDITQEGGLSDDDDDDQCWARVPNGSENWVYQACTLGQSN
jgi:hypothetical protein